MMLLTTMPPLSMVSFQLAPESWRLANALGALVWSTGVRVRKVENPKGCFPIHRDCHCTSNFMVTSTKCGTACAARWTVQTVPSFSALTLYTLHLHILET